MKTKKPVKRYLILILVLAALGYSYSWTYTPHGRLDYRAALSLHLLSFNLQNFRPSPDIDFEFDLPVNLIYAFSDKLPKEEMSKIEDITIPGDGLEIPARIYWPKGLDKQQTPLPVIVYFHGGGFVVGSVEIFDSLTRSLANATNAIVISVDYRLAPAHPYPAAVNDCYTALVWGAKNASRLGGDPNMVILGGDSAGGNLAAVVALEARESAGPVLAAQILYYPATDRSGTSYPGREKFIDGYGLSSEAGRAFDQAYIGHMEDRTDPYISPLYAESLAGLPPALIVTAGFDPLTDSAAAYAKRLVDEGVKVTYQHYPRMIHGFMSVRLFSQQRDALNKTGEFVNQVVNVSGGP